MAIIAGPADFEEGDLTDVDNSSGGVSADASAALGGSYGALFTGGSAGYLDYSTSISGATTTWDGFGLELVSGISMDQFSQIGIWHCLHDDFSTDVKLNLYRNAGGTGAPDEWLISVDGGTGGETAVGLAFDSRMYVTLNEVISASSTVTVKIEGTQIFTETGMDYTGDTALFHRLGPENGGLGASQYIYTDDWTIDNADEPSNPYAGGTTYNEACVDGISIADASGNVMTIPATAADGVGTMDGPGSVLTMPVAATSGVALADVATMAQTIVATLTSGILLTDTSACTLTIGGVAVDGISLADAVTAALVILVSTQDGVSLADVVTDDRTLASGSVSVTISAGDARATITAGQSSATVTVGDSGATIAEG